MSKKQKIAMLKKAKQLIMLCAEKTPPNVTYSPTNHKLASVGLSIDTLIKHFNTRLQQ